MIICHFFTRVIKGTPYLMVVSSSDSDANTHPYPTPTVLFEAAGSRSVWIPRARDVVSAANPGIFPGETCIPDDNRKDQKQCFDIPFYEETDEK